MRVALLAGVVEIADLKWFSQVMLHIKLKNVLSACPPTRR